MIFKGLLHPNCSMRLWNVQILFLFTGCSQHSEVKHDNLFPVPLQVGKGHSALQSHSLSPCFTVLLAIGSSGWRRQVRPRFQLAAAGASKELGTSFDFDAPYNGGIIVQEELHSPGMVPADTATYSEVATCVVYRQKEKSQSSMGNLKGCFPLSSSICAAIGPSLTD